MKLQKQRYKSKLKPFMAMLLAFLMVFGAVPLNVFASEAITIGPELIYEAEPFIARIDGEEVLVAADGIVMVDVAGFNEPMEMEIPRYIYLDGEVLLMCDERIENIAPVLTSAMPFSSFSLDDDYYLPALGFIVSISGTLPSNPVVSQIGQEYTHPAYVRMNSQIVSSRRYVVGVNGVFYEAFCVNRVTRS